MAEPIVVWKFNDAPEELREVSTNGGDEDWLVIVPAEIEKQVEEGSLYIPWLENVGTLSIGVCSIDRYPRTDGSVIYIGTHA